MLHLINIVSKFTSQKPEIRQLKQESIKNLNEPIWVKFFCIEREGENDLRSYINNDEYKKKFLSVMQNAPQNQKRVDFIYISGYRARYTFSKWKSLIAKVQHRSIGLADVLLKTDRIKSFNLSDAILLSYNRDLRFILFLTIFFGFTIWMYIAPDQLLDHPLALCSPNSQSYLIQIIKDTFLNHVCSAHPEVISPCECGEPLNKVARDLFQENSFDPLHIDKKSQIKTVSLMVATIILSIALTESISKYGVYYDIDSLMIS